MTTFASSRIITQKIFEATFRTYFIGFDKDDKGIEYYRIKKLIDLLTRAVPNFAFAYHEEIDGYNAVEKLQEAAESIYRIKEFRDTYEIYKRDGALTDDNIQKKYLARGEFGELILHLLLRDFHETIPLLSKIYFKDSQGVPAHGFDAVHIHPESESLWLGESKLFSNPHRGIDDMIKSIKDHFMMDYLQAEFAIVSKRIKPYKKIPKQKYWLNLMHSDRTLGEYLKSVTIPLLLTYSSKNFEKPFEIESEFIEAFKKEVFEIKQYFESNSKTEIKTNLNIILMLFPVKSKNELVAGLHEKLFLMQNLQSQRGI
ncbi:MAG: DUF1837 domain-containing protein [Candidatus Bathyarchaeota archaeon]|nr:DUF1837 domain-containing protein [Candidatus Bathyarchaeota archaeon]